MISFNLFAHNYSITILLLLYTLTHYVISYYIMIVIITFDFRFHNF